VLDPFPGQRHHLDRGRAGGAALLRHGARSPLRRHHHRPLAGHDRGRGRHAASGETFDARDARDAQRGAYSGSRRRRGCHPTDCRWRPVMRRKNNTLTCPRPTRPTRWATAATAARPLQLWPKWKPARATEGITEPHDPAVPSVDQKGHGHRARSVAPNHQAGSYAHAAGEPAVKGIPAR
jgi:hypothetical protein